MISHLKFRSLILSIKYNNPTFIEVLSISFYNYCTSIISHHFPCLILRKTSPWIFFLVCKTFINQKHDLRLQNITYIVSAIKKENKENTIHTSKVQRTKKGNNRRKAFYPRMFLFLLFFLNMAEFSSNSPWKKKIWVFNHVYLSL